MEFLFKETLIPLVYAISLLTYFSDVQGQIQFQGRRKASETHQLRSAATCQTATAKSGTCIPILNCRRYWGRDNTPDLGNSSCGTQNQAMVCCPLADDTEGTTSITPKRLTKISKPEIVPNQNSTQPDSVKHERRTAGAGFPQNCGRSAATFSRIVGGQDSILGAWPWMAILYIIRRGIKSAECGGTLVTSQHVITAAHCIVTSRRGTTLNPRQLLVRLGELNIETDDDGAHPIDIGIQSVAKHDGFNLQNFQNDIAILELKESVEFSSMISPICLPFNMFSEMGELVDRNAMAAGWGSTRYGGRGSAALQEVQLRIWTNELCKEVFRRDVPITHANLCAGEDDKDACRGDSGGPLMLPDENGIFYLVGIVSFGKKCADPGIPGVYARVTTFLDWIEQNIG